MVQREFGDKVEVVGINQAAHLYSLDDWRRFWTVSGALNVTWAQDHDLQATRAYKVTALGTTIVIDRKGRIVYRDEGVTSYDTLRSEIDEVL